MHTIVIKYVQLFCIALLFDNASCDNLPLEASRDNLFLNCQAGCTAVCMERNLTAVIAKNFTKHSSIQWIEIAVFLGSIKLLRRMSNVQSNDHADDIR